MSLKKWKYSKDQFWTGLIGLNLSRPSPRQNQYKVNEACYHNVEYNLDEKHEPRLSVDKVWNFQKVENIQSQQEILKQKVENQCSNHQPNVSDPSQIQNIALNIGFNISEVPLDSEWHYLLTKHR